ncbi:hypothetical protein [Mycolicibacterium komossense]|uniref:Uncharacterized protein n=1 Tax=Mycolicibacterium komossense TaxID=1779 RepID=A0ABT3CDI5_9MYCO|nr:hypothetical protein [Mycolicibacterium komossense]MCV7227550.1 hypothetical protein [Mycolicibacterium komossense]
MNATFRRLAAGAALAIAPALLAVGVAATSHAGNSIVVPNPGPQIHAGKNYAGGGQGVNGTNIKPGSREHHHWQRMQGIK